MAGLTAAARPCQPTNPPPKRYKPPIMTKAQPQGNPQEHNMCKKINDPTCGAGTPGYAASYRHILSSTRHSTMTLPTGTPNPTLQQNTAEHATNLAVNTIITSTQASTVPHHLKLHTVVTHKMEKNQLTSHRKPLSPINGRNTTPATNDMMSKQATIPHNRKLHAVVTHKTEMNRPTTHRKFQPLCPINGQHTTPANIGKKITKTTVTHPTNPSIVPIPQPDNPKCTIRNNQNVAHANSSLPHPSHPCNYGKPKLFPPLTRFASHRQIPPDNHTNQPHQPDNLRPPAAIPEEPNIEPPHLHATCQPSPPMLSHPHHNLGPAITTPAQKWSKNGEYTQTVHPTQLPPLRSAIDSIIQSSMISLRKELMLTRNLLDQLIRLLPLALNAPPRTTSKTLFELITELPKNDPLPLLTTFSHTPAYLYLPNSFPEQPTAQTTYRIPSNPSYAKTRIFLYLSTILLWSMLQFTVQYSKDLLKVP